MRKLGNTLLFGALGAAFLALAACASPDGDDAGVPWFSDATVRVDLDRARQTQPSLTSPR
ncbi:MAG: hypothetical protein AB7G15_03255 [Alphaproteobacteria bacterium]